MLSGAAAVGTAAPVPGHLTKVWRFSNTSRRSFLSRRCRGDLVYEPVVPDTDDDLGT
jgi:hypothetical protein